MRIVLILLSVLLLGSVLHGTPPTSPDVHDAAHVSSAHVHMEDTSASEQADAHPDHHNHVHLSADLARGHALPVRYPAESPVFTVEHQGLRPWLDQVPIEPPSTFARI